MVKRVTLLIALSILLAGCTSTQPPPNPHWQDKATWNESAASARLGGFNTAQATLYHNGIQHIKNTHQNIGGFTIQQVTTQEQAREDARNAVRQRAAYEKAAADQERADAKAAAEQQERDRVARAEYEAAHHDYCAEALSDEHVASSDSVSHSAAYQAAVNGLAANEQCTDDDQHLINEGYLLSMKGLAEHYLSEGDSRTDLNQANSLLVQCQTTPGIYGTHVGASCETQEQNNISAQTNWDVDSNE